MEEIKKPSLSELFGDLKKHRRLYYKLLPAVFLVTAVLTLSVPNYYHCTVMLAPEVSGAKSGGGLSSLANSFGINLGGAGNGTDALLPTLYPDLMNSVTFRASLFPIKIQRGDDSSQTMMTYYDYLKDGQKVPWWLQAGKALYSLFKSRQPESDKVNTFKLTKEQNSIVKDIGKKVVCDVDKKSMVITIDVTDQDPLICATIADSVRVRLQDFITDYRTSKARVDLEYTRKLYAEAKTRYDEARRKYAAYTDANQKVFLERIRSQQAELQTELQLRETAYTQIASRLQLAEAKVQEETPAFTTLQPATVPIEKAGPKRSRTCLLMLLLALIAISVYAIHKEGHLVPLFRARGEHDDFDELSLEDLAYLISKERATDGKRSEKNVSNAGEL